MAIPMRKWYRLLFLIFLGVLVLGETSMKLQAEPSIYSVEEVEYFKEIAFQVEYGSETHQIHKWVEELRIEVQGEPKIEDLEALDQTIKVLNSLSDQLKVRFNEEHESANVKMYFIPHSGFSAHDYIDQCIVCDNWGLGMIWWNRLGEIYRADILIATDATNSLERAHLIQEELTQCLGLLNDSWEDCQSIFYQGWGTQSYTERDKKMVEILYDKRVKPNMGEKELYRVLNL